MTKMAMKLQLNERFFLKECHSETILNVEKSAHSSHQNGFLLQNHTAFNLTNSRRTFSQNTNHFSDKANQKHSLFYRSTQIVYKTLKKVAQWNEFPQKPIDTSFQKFMSNFSIISLSFYSSIVWRDINSYMTSRFFLSSTFCFVSSYCFVKIT